MKKFCLITNIYKDPDRKVTDSCLAYIREKGGTAEAIISDYRTERKLKISDIPEDTECILVLGGDGTLIRVATQVQELQIPLIGVNLGTLGYLCEVNETSVYKAIDRLFDDLYLIEDRIMLTGHRKGSEDRKLALNDVVIHHGGDIQILNLKVYVNGEFLVKYSADGIIVATPTGSTGYSMSAGGPIVDPKGDMILLTPNNAHSLGSKSIVLSGEDEIEIEIEQRTDAQGKIYVSLDGDRVTSLEDGERYVICRASNRVHICKLNKRSFLEILSKKMGS